MNGYDRKRWLFLAGWALVMALILVFANNERRGLEEETTAVENRGSMGIPGTGSAVSVSAVLPEPEPTENPENSVYSFLQGPKSWKERREWSGRWGKEFHDGGSFGGFGCGFCAMANIYSTLTDYRCTPLDIYGWTKKNTSYTGGGAVAWAFMRKIMSDLGFTVKLGEKPSTYNRFKAEMEQAQAMLVLVSSYDDDSYWQDTPGHYVTLFLYRPDIEQVFLTDSGDPDHNRHWVPLKTIYKSLKTSSDFQYMSVISYEEEKDQWKHKQAAGTWVAPGVNETTDS